jgi:hypothetical protein
MSFARARNVLGFLFIWLLAWIFWGFILRSFTGHHGENPIVQGLAVNTIA